MKKIIGYSLIGMILFVEGIRMYIKFGYWAVLLLPLYIIIVLSLGLFISWLISD